MSVPARPPLTPVGSALAGALGAVFANAAVYPLDTVKVRLQALPAGPTSHETPRITEEKRPARVHGVSPATLVHVLLKRLKRWEMLAMLVRIIRTEGVFGAFKGFSANMINTFSQQFAYFFFHTFLRSTAQSYRAKQGLISPLGTSAELALGAAAGGLAQIFTIPVAVIATRQQLWTPPSGAGAHREPSLLDTAKEIVSEGGITALWTGLKPGLVLTVNPAITYGVFERLKTWRLAERGPGGKLGVGEAFWMGVVSKTLATVVTYPYIFAKVRLQAKQTPEPIIEHTTGKDEHSFAAVAASASDSASAGSTDASGAKLHGHAAARVPSKGAVQLLSEVYSEKGLAGWYQGLCAQIVKAVLCQGILFVSKDQFEGSAGVIMDQLARVTGKAI